jgi:cytochrome c oxidase assembly protein subunit 15
MQKVSGSWPGFVRITTLLIFGQLVLGATMRHQHAGLAIPDFPLAYGKVWPAMDSQSLELYNQHRMENTAVNPITSFQIGLQMAHRIVAGLILVAVAFCAWGIRNEKTLGRLGVAWLTLILCQAFLGAATIWSNKAADIATAHVVIGALSLAMGAVMTILASRGVVLAGRNAAPSGATEALPQASFEARRPVAAGLE